MHSLLFLVFSLASDFASGFLAFSPPACGYAGVVVRVVVRECMDSCSCINPVLSEFGLWSSGAVYYSLLFIAVSFLSRDVWQTRRWFVFGFFSAARLRHGGVIVHVFDCLLHIFCMQVECILVEYTVRCYNLSFAFLLLNAFGMSSSTLLVSRCFVCVMVCYSVTLVIAMRLRRIMVDSGLWLI